MNKTLRARGEQKTITAAAWISSVLAGRHAQLGEGSTLSHTQSSTKWSPWKKARAGQ